ncbi:ABC transporter permease [Streptococcus sp. DD13]|uniref:ABC transporter permease n=1 Tax=Streptococcus sp. DD13 TaxID=1777881 RepID=UPI00079A1121|nr:ABC transporter permease [Streptococcus sp. DD13]KXT79083.1 ABC transporter membrane-spanning permease, Pep export, Vex3 [Streptococcus sp. DD13]
MRPIQRAWAYVRRKRWRSVTLFSIFLLLLAGSSACLTLMVSKQSVEKNLYRSFNSSFFLKKLGEDQNFSLSEVESVGRISGVESLAPELVMLANLRDKEVVSGQQAVVRNDLEGQASNLLGVTALMDSAREARFTSSSFKLTKGRSLQKGDQQKILIHQELAQKNNLEIGDRLELESLGIDGKEGKPLPFEIVGIFSGKQQERFTGLSSDFSENQVFIDYDSSQRLLGVSKQTVSKARFFVQSPDQMSSILQQVRQMGLEAKGFQLEQDNHHFEQVKESVDTFQSFLQLFLYGILLAGAGSLILVLSLWLRDRIYEVGILLSLGQHKGEILLQFCLEILILSLGALLPAFVTARVGITYLLQTLLAGTEQVGLQETIAQTSGIATSLLVFAQAYAFLLFLAFSSVSLCFVFLFRKSPKEILSSMS